MTGNSRAGVCTTRRGIEGRGDGGNGGIMVAPRYTVGISVTAQYAHTKLHCYLYLPAYVDRTCYCTGKD